MTKLLLLFLINFTTIISISIGRVEIAALLQFFALAVAGTNCKCAWLSGLA